MWKLQQQLRSSTQPVSPEHGWDSIRLHRSAAGFWIMGLAQIISVEFRYVFGRVERWQSRLIAHDSKSCRGNTLVGSNPALSVEYH